MVLVYSVNKNDGRICVHQNLLHGRVLKHGQQKDTTIFERDDADNLFIRIWVDSFRGLTLWSGWLYGRPMWSLAVCENVDLDLKGLTDIYNLCAGDPGDDPMDFDVLNACVDAIRDVLLNEVHVPKDPLGTLGYIFAGDPMSVKMLTESLVWGNCASDGRTRRWLEEAEESLFLESSDGFQALSMEFAKNAMGGGSPNLMAPCAYHVHPSGTRCGGA